MSKTLVVLWLGAQAARPALQADLDAWATARWATLAEPKTDAPAGLTHDEALVTRAEELLEQARIASASLDDEVAHARLTEVERLLTDHPEWPQVAWLMAEQLYVHASVESRTIGGGPSSREMERAARALDGPRALPFGAAEPAADAEPARVSVALRGPEPKDVVYWNGLPASAPLHLLPGKHHARVIRRGRAVWAGWVQVAPDDHELTLAVPPSVPCSLDDLSGTSLRADQVKPPSSVRCSEWAVARPATGGGVEVATCRGPSCGPLVVWKRRYGAIYEGPPQPPPEPGFPAWASYALAGVGAAALGGFVLWQAGAFDEPEPGKTRWEFYGPSR
jgi:hypothetical protein